MPKKLENKKEAESHDDLKGFSMRIDEFGLMQSSLSVDRLNDFLDKNVEDARVPAPETEEE